MSFSVLILTKNEEINIDDCIESVKECDDIVVFDSFSSDNTVHIAEKHNVRIFQNRFADYGSQREAARKNVDYKYPWVLALDADERVTPELYDELRTVTCNTSFVAAYRLRRKDYFRDKWLKYSSLYPSWHLRFYQPQKIHYPPRSVHEYPVVDGAVEALHGHLIHHNFSKGVQQWWKRHLEYAALEAIEIANSKKNQEPVIRLLLSRDPVLRRQGLKKISYCMPMRPILRYLYMMILRRGIFDGPAGWEYCKMIATYQWITDQIVRDSRKTSKQLKSSTYPSNIE
tara:strand:+ start:3516 stop:4373 length:858 start_codon:yes stop_codon:yes gene_type:complete